MNQSPVIVLGKGAIIPPTVRARLVISGRELFFRRPDSVPAFTQATHVFVRCGPLTHEIETVMWRLQTVITWRYARLNKPLKKTSAKHGKKSQPLDMTGALALSPPLPTPEQIERKAPCLPKLQEVLRRGSECLTFDAQIEIASRQLDMRDEADALMVSGRKDETSQPYYPTQIASGLYSWWLVLLGLVEVGARVVVLTSPGRQAASLASFLRHHADVRRRLVNFKAPVEYADTGLVPIAGFEYDKSWLKADCPTNNVTVPPDARTLMWNCPDGDDMSTASAMYEILACDPVDTVVAAFRMPVGKGNILFCPDWFVNARPELLGLSKNVTDSTPDVDNGSKTNDSQQVSPSPSSAFKPPFCITGITPHKAAGKGDKREFNIAYTSGGVNNPQQHDVSAKNLVRFLLIWKFSQGDGYYFDCQVTKTKSAMSFSLRESTIDLRLRDTIKNSNAELKKIFVTSNLNDLVAKCIGAILPGDDKTIGELLLENPVKTTDRYLRCKIKNMTVEPKAIHQLIDLLGTTETDFNKAAVTVLRQLFPD